MSRTNQTIKKPHVMVNTRNIYKKMMSTRETQETKIKTHKNTKISHQRVPYPYSAITVPM